MTYEPPPPPPFPADIGRYGSVPPPRGQGRGVLIAVLGLAGLLVLAGVAVIVIVVTRGGPDSGESVSGALKTPIRFQQVTSKAPGACTGGGVPAADGTTCYQLADGMTVSDVKSIKVVGPSDVDPGFRLLVSLRPADARAFAALSAKAAAAGAEQPGNQVAIVVGGKVVSAPAVQSTITGGDIEISGGFDRPAAERLFRQITTGSP